MAQFLYDRGGFWQLKEYEECSFVPYRDVVQKIVKEEAGHQDLGEKIVVEQCQTGRYDDVKQPSSRSGCASGSSPSAGRARRATASPSSRGSRSATPASA